MRFITGATLVASIATVGCKETKVLEPLPRFHLTATFTERNTCSVSVLGHDFASSGMIRGDVPKDFVGTVAAKSYHGFGCWVARTDGDGDVVILFSQNNFGKPLVPGTYKLTHEVLDETPLGYATVTFRTFEIGGDKLTTVDDSQGSVVVEATANGGRTIKVDADLVRWGNVF